MYHSGYLIVMASFKQQKVFNINGITTRKVSPEQGKQILKHMYNENKYLCQRIA